MTEITTSIIPQTPIIIGPEDELDLTAICEFVACGFFLGESCYWKGQRCLLPARTYKLRDGRVLDSTENFSWYYEPRDISLTEATDEFAEILETALEKGVAGKQVILPLSGGLDSRTIAAALKRIGAETRSFSYAFTDGHDETVYAERIAGACEFDFTKFLVPRGYLWDSVDRLSEINGCYSDFTHPRQMAFVDELSVMGEVFALGHWGDVLFDEMGIADDADFASQLSAVKKKVIKPGGFQLAEELWKHWNLNGVFSDHIEQKLSEMLEGIKIPDSANAKIRAFKSLYWAPRWTSVNLSVFSSVAPVAIPYYEDAMCRFVSSVPERLLSGRQIQIEYLKKFAPELASISWQSERPFNLYTYKWNKSPWNLPYRVFDKLRRQASGTKLIERNWELQFEGDKNSENLNRFLFQNPALTELVSEPVVRKFYDQFIEGNSIVHSHAVSMLLTLSQFLRRNEASSDSRNVVAN